MTREEAKKLFIPKAEIVVDTIYDHFESRVCENYAKDSVCAIQILAKRQECNNFGCNKFTPKV